MRSSRSTAIAVWLVLLSAAGMAAQSAIPAGPGTPGQPCPTTTSITTPVPPPPPVATTTISAPTEAPTHAPQRSYAAGELAVYAAASLKDAFGTIRADFERAHPGTSVVSSFDASTALRAQIEQGAPADVFASADMKNPQALADEGLTTGPPTPFAGNRLTIVVPSGNPGAIGSAYDLARPGIKIVAAGEEVPITKYAAQVVANLAAQPDAPCDFAASYAVNIVSREDNVRQVLAKIELGEGDAAIVYVTDAVAAGSVETVVIPDAANVTATYGAVVIGGSPSQVLASDFMAELIGPTGQATLASFGFLPPP